MKVVVTQHNSDIDRPKRRRCRNCKKEKLVTATNESKSAPVIQLSSENEARRLWGQAMIGTTSFVTMIESYCDFGVPGVPVDAINKLAVRLEQAVKAK